MNKFLLTVIAVLTIASANCYAGYAEASIIKDKASNIYAPVDTYVPALVVIQEEHHQAHLGKEFRSVATFPALANGATAYVLIKTSTTCDLHLHISYNVGGNAFINLSSAPVFTSSGTELIYGNLNQEHFADLKPCSQIWRGAGVTDIGGLIIDEAFIEGGTGPQSAGSSGAGAVEWILDNGEYYLISVRNEAGSAKNLSVVMQWYEVEH